MQKNMTGLWLQFFADDASGAEAAAAEPAGVIPAAAGQDAGVTAAAAGQQFPSLEELGVPKDMAERYRARKAKAGQTSPTASAAAEPPATEEPAQAAAAAEGTDASQAQSEPDWDELMKNPNLNRKMQETVRATVNSRIKPMQKQLKDMTPMVTLLAGKYGMDTSDMSKFDYAALAKAVADDDYFYDDMSDRLGMDLSAAKQSFQREQELSAREQELSAREQAMQQPGYQAGDKADETIEELMVRRHWEKMHKDAERLKQLFPDFDLQKELQDRRFAAMVSPSGGLSVEDAFYAIHRREIDSARMQQMQSAISRNLQSGGQIPKENGARAPQSQPSGQKRYSQMSREERAAYKKSLTGSSSYESGSFVSGRR